MKNIIKIILFLSIPLSIFAQDTIAPVRVYKPGDNELFLMPTAYTMPAGNSYFSDYELFSLNYSIAVTSSTHISAFSLFPVAFEFYKTFTIGIKQNIANFGNLHSALYGTFTIENSLYVLGGVVSIGSPNKSFHVSAAYGNSGSSNIDKVWLFMAGGRIDPSENVSLIVEWENLGTLLDSPDFSGLLTIGVRLSSSNLSWEIAGIRPLIGYSGNFLFFPLLKVGYYFN